MKTNSPKLHGKSISAMSLTELEALLQAEMAPDQEIDADLILAVTEELEERTPNEVDVDAAWNSFIHNHLPYEPLHQDKPGTTAPNSKQSSKKGLRRRIVRIGLIAAAMVVVLIGTVSASRFELWDAITKWSSETLGLSFGEKKSVECNPEYTEIKAALEHENITVKLIPRYLPDGYKQSEFYSDSRQYFAAFENGEHTISIRINVDPPYIGEQYEIDDSSSEKYAYADIDHIISTNMGLYRAVWVNGEYECSINNVPSKEDLLLMIDSIYMED